MALSRELRDEQVPAGRKSRPFITSDRIIRWVAMPGIGLALAAWSVATLSSIYDAGASTSRVSRGLLAPAALSFARPLESRARSFKAWVPAENGQKPVIPGAKTARLASLGADAAKPLAPTARESAGDRFDGIVAKAALSHGKLAAAFARSGMKLAPAEDSVEVASAGPSVEIPAAERFYHLTSHGLAMPDENGPAPSRFGPRIAEMERSSRLALALAGAMEMEVDVVPDGTQLASLEPGDGTAGSVFEDFPEDVPLPARRPRYEPSEPARQAKRSGDDAQPSRQASQPEEAQPAKPARRTQRSGQALAYARPETDDNGGNGGGFGGVFKNLFSSKPRAGEGVAVYNIAEATVTMPDGTRLEAHSGVGHMADNAKYADQKMRGPTPPGTYTLTMREALFHGVEAIRMTPVGKNKYGRNGILAHTEMLRGRPEQSNGCVAFKDYKRFLKAFKRGKVTRMVVIPGGSHSSGTAVADNGRGV